MRWMHRSIVVFALVVCVFAPLAEARGGTVAVEVERLIRGAPLRGAAIGVSIRDAETGAVLYAHNASRPLIPASNMKLLTSGAALHVLGADFQFTTTLLRDGERLIVRGDGDPGFGDPELLALTAVPGSDEVGIDIEEMLKLWTDAVRKAGITRINELVIDDRIFDRDFVHSGWPVDQLNRRYCAEVAGLNFHLNVLHFVPAPGRDGGRPTISRYTPYVTWLDISNSATSRMGADDRNDVWISRQLGTNRLRFHGNVKFEYRVPVPVTVHNMPDFFARMFSDRLRDTGVRVGQWRVADPDEPPSTGDVVGPLISTPISTAVLRCNRDSQNLYAEALLKRAGAALTQQPGSWVNGPAIIRHAVHHRLSNAALTASIVVSDGSGLSRDNRVSAETLTAWLNTFHHDSILGPIFIDTLAVPGDSGTLRNRFRGGDLHGATVQAKSGYISGVSCLSGYVTMPDGRRRSFSVLINDVQPAVLATARTLQEQIVITIARDMAAAAVTMGSD
jgi:serine-type D-Ala-D-Ala carboxypeptidase/endopeptidase (penicillin-binding protein 4)